MASRGSLVTVHAQSAGEAERAVAIMDDFGAVDVNERAAAYDSPTNSDSAKTAPIASVDTGTTVSGTANDTDLIPLTKADQTIRVIEENLQVGKREVTSGGVRLRSRIVEQPVKEILRLRKERVSIERNPVNRPATEADLAAFREGQIELIKHRGVPVIAKTANVFEEISINKAVTEREEVIHDTVRKTDVQVENRDSANATNPSEVDDHVTYSTT